MRAIVILAVIFLNSSLLLAQTGFLAEIVSMEAAPIPDDEASDVKMSFQEIVNKKG